MAGVQTIGSLERGLQILNLLQKKGELGVTEIAKELGVNKSSAYRLLATLEENGFAEQVSDGGKYRLGMGLAKFQARVLDDVELRALARPFLRQISEETGEAVGFCIMNGVEGLLIDKVNSTQNIGATLIVGMAEPLYCTSLGKILLSSFDKEEQRRLLCAVERVKRTPKTVTDLETLLAESEAIAENGFTVDDEQYAAGMRCIAVPVRDYTGKVVASMGISAPIDRISDEVIESRIKTLKRLAEKLSKKLGY